MIDSNDNTLDIVKELRLRQWARLHYVPPAQRSTSWHPVVLDEMGLRDAELHDAELPSVAAVQRASSFVPLPPAQYHEIHARHADPAEPKVVKSRRSQRV